MEYRPRYLYAELSAAVQARKNCAKPKPDGNLEWFDNWTETINKLVELLPSGSGFDNGTKIDLDASHAEKLVLETSFHHMDDMGGYDGWTEHTVTVTPGFRGINLRISGPNRNDIKEYMHETFDYALTSDVTYEVLREHFPQFAIENKWEDKDGSPSQCYQAFYVPRTDGAVRFWNDWTAARDYAARKMHEAFYAPRTEEK